MRKRYGERMDIVQFQDPGREPDRIFAANVDKVFEAFLRAPKRARIAASDGAIAGAWDLWRVAEDGNVRVKRSRSAPQRARRGRSAR